MAKKLEELTYLEYSVLQTSGTLKSIYPEATGKFEEDCTKSEDNTIGKEFRNDIEK